MTPSFKTIISLAALSLLLAACSSQKEKTEEAQTMEQIHEQQGKPATVISAQESSVKDVRRFSGSIEGIRQTSAIAKMSDPVAKINVQVGSSVKKDQTLAEFIYTGDNTQYQQAEAQVKLLEASNKRIHDVYEKGGISKQNVDESDTQLEIAKMNMETARRATLVLAPASGVVTDVRFKVGEVPKLGDVMFTVANLDHVVLKLNITSKDIALFKKNQNAYVVQHGDTLVGKVSMVPLAANATTRFFPVEITFKNKAKKLLPGMFVTAEINVGTLSGLTVPNDAVVYQNGINYLWLVNEKGNATRKVISVLMADQTNTVVEGIHAGDKVMVTGMSKMNEGDKVLIVKQ